jgi:hypothetical protein
MDRTHLFRGQAVGRVPKLDVILGVSFQHLSGVPWAGQYAVRLPQGRIPVYVEPRGSRRLDSQTLLDLRVSKDFALTGSARLELLVDVFNVFNVSTYQSANSSAFTDAFGDGRGPMDPRKAMLGARLTF